MAIFASGFFLGYSITTWLSTVQLIVPSVMQGRYFGVDQLGSFAVIPVGQILGGYLIAASGIRFDMWFAGGGLIVTSAVFLAAKSFRTLGYRSSTASDSA